MNDELMRQLEGELAGLRPARVPGKLAAGIAERLGEAPLTVGDRMLAGFMMGGALAASVMVAIVVLSVATGAPASRDRGDAQTAAREQMVREYHLLLAQR